MGAEVSRRKVYGTCQVAIDDVLMVIKKATELILENTNDDKVLGYRLSYTIGLLGDHEVHTDNFDEFKSILFEYGSKELVKINVDLSNYEDRFNLSFNYAYSTIGNLELRVTSKSGLFSDLSDLLDRKVSRTLNFIFHDTAPTLILGFVASLLLALNLIVFLKRQMFMDNKQLYIIFIATFGVIQALYYFLNDKFFAKLYPNLVLTSTGRFDGKGRNVGKDMGRVGVWLFILIVGGTILNLLGLG